MARKTRADESLPGPPYFRHTYYLHIDRNGEEIAYRVKPDPRTRPTLEISAYDDVEYTRTDNRYADGDRVRVRPPGAGWRVADDSNRDYTDWSRRVGS